MRRRLFLTLLVTGIGAPLAAQSDDGLRFRIRQDTIVDGVRCGSTGRAYAVIYENGRLDECPIAADTVVAGHHFPRGTWIRLTDDGVLKSVWLMAPMTVQGLPCRGTGFKGWAVTFHRSGRLSLCYLDEEATINGVPCAAATFLRELTGNSGVSLREDGRLHSCRLARDFVYGGMPHKKGSRLTLPER